LLQLSLETFLGFRKKEKKLWPWLQQKKKNEEGNMLNLLFPLLPKNGFTSSSSSLFLKKIVALLHFLLFFQIKFLSSKGFFLCKVVFLHLIFFKKNYFEKKSRMKKRRRKEKKRKRIRFSVFLFAFFFLFS
jgi:hypothetical protein